MNLHDLHWATQAAERFPSREMCGSMRAQMPDGMWRTGWFAGATLLETSHVGRALGRLMRLPEEILRTLRQGLIRSGRIRGARG